MLKKLIHWKSAKLQYKDWMRKKWNERKETSQITEPLIKTQKNSKFFKFQSISTLHQEIQEIDVPLESEEIHIRMFSSIIFKLFKNIF